MNSSENQTKYFIRTDIMPSLITLRNSKSIDVFFLFFFIFKFVTDSKLKVYI